MYLDGFGKFLVIFVQKYFSTLVKKKIGPKNHFLAISQIDYLNEFLVKFPS